MSRQWPRGVAVGHTNNGYQGDELGRLVSLDLLGETRRMLTTDEARAVAAELVLRADYQDRLPSARAVDAIPRRCSPQPAVDLTCPACLGSGGHTLPGLYCLSCKGSGRSR